MNNISHSCFKISADFSEEPHWSLRLESWPCERLFLPTTLTSVSSEPLQQPQYFHSLSKILHCLYGKISQPRSLQQKEATVGAFSVKQPRTCAEPIVCCHASTLQNLFVRWNGPQHHSGSGIRTYLCNLIYAPSSLMGLIIEQVTWTEFLLKSMCLRRPQTSTKSSCRGLFSSSTVL